MKGCFIFIISSLVLFSSQVAYTLERIPKIMNKDIIEKLVKLEEGQKSLEQEFKTQIGNINGRIDDLDRKLNKRIDDLRKEMNGRFNDVNARIDDVNARFHDVNARIDDLRKEMKNRFHDVNARIDDLRKEMNAQFNTLQWMFGLFIGISIIILAFVLRMLWLMQKRQVKLEATLSYEKEELSFIRNLVEKIVPSKGAA